MSFVFHDPTGKRWTRLRRLFVASGLGLLVVAAFAVASATNDPRLPALALRAVPHADGLSLNPSPAGAAQAVPYRFRANANEDGRDPRLILHPRNHSPAHAADPLVFGYYVNWDPGSVVSLRVNLANLTHLIPEWLSLRNGEGDITDQTDRRVARIAQDAKLPILVEVNNYRDGAWNADDLHGVLNEPGARANLINNLYDYVAEHRFRGVNVDLEVLPKEDGANFAAFMSALRVKLHSGGFVLTQSVPLDEPAYDLSRLGKIDDYVVPMLYDEHYASAVPGPVASQEWFEHRLARLLDVLPAEKTVIGVGNYGYDWTIGSRAGASGVNYSDVIQAADEHGGIVSWDDDTENPVLRYRRGRERHEVWFLDATTALNQVLASAGDGYRGVAFWRLGSEDPGVWNLFPAHAWPSERFYAGTLERLGAENSVRHYGAGELLRLVGRPREGRRDVWKSGGGDFAERYRAFPTYYAVEHPAEGSPKTVSLTFDDGPSSYTPAILDVLARKGVLATFFVIGMNAERYPGVLRREYDEGHTLGNHTYAHHNATGESENETRLGLTATQRLIEATTGHATVLFRPPYAADSQPQTPAEMLPIDRAATLGYLTVGERIDPRDWEGPSADEIVDQVLAQRDDGHLILLHDGGGDRSETVKALPLVIDRLRARGYRFVPIEQLIGRSRDQLMPIPNAGERRWAVFESSALFVNGTFGTIVAVLLRLTLALMGLRALAYGALAIAQKFRTRRRRFDPSYHPDVSVVIPAYNEERVIVSTVRSILDNGYDRLQVIVVDDGSKDATLAVLRDAFAEDRRVTILAQPNGGKSSALNVGFAQAAAEIVVALDADTVFQAGTIERLVRHFADPKVGAVSGNAQVGNRRTWLARFQALEYVCSFNLDRRALDLLNAHTVVPGAVGAWRKAAVIAAGGFSHETLAEDTDLTLALGRLGYEIRYEQTALAFTEAPETTKALAQQRFRWTFGTLQSAWKHRDVTLNRRYGYLGMVALPSIWIFQLLLSAISPVAEFSILIAILLGNWKIVALFYAALLALDFVSAGLAYILEGQKPWGLALLVAQRIYYRFLMYFVVVKSIVYALRGGLVAWEKLERRATVASQLSTPALEAAGVRDGATL